MALQHGTVARGNRDGEAGRDEQLFVVIFDDGIFQTRREIGPAVSVAQRVVGLELHIAVLSGNDRQPVVHRVTRLHRHDLHLAAQRNRAAGVVKRARQDVPHVNRMNFAVDFGVLEKNRVRHRRDGVAV